MDAVWGRSHYSKRTHKQGGQKCFFYMRSDGHEGDFSVNKCIEGLKVRCAKQAERAQPNQPSKLHSNHTWQPMHVMHACPKLAACLVVCVWYGPFLPALLPSSRSKHTHAFRFGRG